MYFHQPFIECLSQYFNINLVFIVRMIQNRTEKSYLNVRVSDDCQLHHVINQVSIVEDLFILETAVEV